MLSDCTPIPTVPTADLDRARDFYQNTLGLGGAEEVMEVEKDLLREYADPTLKEPPADLMKRGGAYYSTVATQLLNAHRAALPVRLGSNSARSRRPAN